jgi:hypothetical protein
VASAVAAVDPPGCLSKDAAARLPASSSSAAAIELRRSPSWRDRAMRLTSGSRPPEAGNDQVRPRPYRIWTAHVGSNGAHAPRGGRSMKYRPPPDPGMAFHERRLTFMPRLATPPPLPTSISLFPAADIHGAAPSAATSTATDAAAQ